MIKHEINHVYQPTNHTCCQSALSMLLSFFDIDISPEEVASKVPVCKNEKGEEVGSVVQKLATWCILEGFEASLYTADYQILDLSWVGLSRGDLIRKMKEVLDTREVPAIGREWTKIYLEEYINFAEAGGNIEIIPYVSEELLDRLLVDSPVHITVNQNVFSNKGRTKNTGLRKSELDYKNGELNTHSILVYGKNDEGKYLVADPWTEPGLLEVEPELLIVSVAAAQIECDSIIFQLRKK